LKHPVYSENKFVQKGEANIDRLK